jgi:phosphate transport system permease protein
MRLSTILLIYAVILFAGYLAGRRKAMLIGMQHGSLASMHSLPAYHGYNVMIWGALPALAAIIAYLAFADAFILAQVQSALPDATRALPDAQLNLVLNDIKNLAAGSMMSGEPTAALVAASKHLLGLQETLSILLGIVVIALSAGGCGWAWQRTTVENRARNSVERVIIFFLLLAASVAVLTTIGILLSVVFEAIRFFEKVPLTDFLFGTTWSPQTAIRADQVGSSGSFGAVPLFAGTLMITGIAMLVAVPLGLMVAIYMAEYISPRARTIIKPMLEVLAGIPTVVYGYFAALTVAPFLRNFGIEVGLDVSAESALGVGLVMGVMILPFISSLSDDVITAVPQG